jgi:hypothetical protein
VAFNQIPLETDQETEIFWHPLEKVEVVPPSTTSSDHQHKRKTCRRQRWWWWYDASCCWWVWVNETHSVHLCRKELHWFLLKEEGNSHSLSLSLSL